MVFLAPEGLAPPIQQDVLVEAVAVVVGTMAAAEAAAAPG
jgi:hypothetical protein